MQPFLFLLENILDPILSYLSFISVHSPSGTQSSQVTQISRNGYCLHIVQYISSCDLSSCSSVYQFLSTRPLQLKVCPPYTIVSKSSTFCFLFFFLFQVPLSCTLSCTQMQAEVNIFFSNDLSIKSFMYMTFLLPHFVLYLPPLFTSFLFCKTSGF